MDHFKAVFEKINLIKSNEERIAKMSGNNFNIFKVLGLSSDENRLHSAFIAELLNPNGSHAQSDLFLTLFIQNVYPEKFRDFDTKNATVITEHHFSGNDTGRIDILISESQVNNPKAILIENKIYAGDQENQLVRYYQYGQNAFQNNFLLYYLSLDGHEPSDFSTGSEDSKLKSGKHYFPISYADQILNWLTLCFKESAALPGIRETIAQYITILSNLCGISNPFTMATKLEELITIDQSNLESLLELKSSFKWFLIERQEKFWELLKTNFSDNSMKVRFFHQHTIISQWNNRIIKNYYDGVRNNKGYGLVIDLFSIDDYSLKLKVELGDYLQYGVMAYKDNIMKWERALKKSPLPENIDRIKNNLLDKYNWESRDISWGWLVWKKREKTISFREDTKSMKFISDFYENGENSEAFKSLVEDISEDYKVLMDQQYK